MSTESNFDVSVNYDTLVAGIGSIKNINSGCSSLVSALSSVDVSILDTGYLLYAAINTVQGIMKGSITTILGRVTDVETLFHLFQSEEFYEAYKGQDGEIDVEELVIDMLRLASTQENCFDMVQKYDEVLERYSVMLKEIEKTFSCDSQEYLDLFKATSLVNTLRDCSMDYAFSLFACRDDFEQFSTSQSRIAKVEYGFFSTKYYDVNGNLLTDVSDIEAAFYLASTGKSNFFNGDYDDIYKYLTDDERKVATYLANTGNFDQLETYMDFKTDATSQRHGQELANEVINKINSYYVNADSELEKSAAYAKTLALLTVEGLGDGIGNFFDGISNLFSADGKVSAEQYKTSFLVSDLNTRFGDSWFAETFATGAYEISSSIGNMLPSIAIGTFAPFLGAPAAFAKIASSTAMALSAAGGSREQGLQSGMSQVQSWVYGILSGSSEAVLERFLGGIPVLSNLEGKGLIGKMFSEATEESVQSVLDPLFNTMVTGEKYVVDWNEVLKSGIYGAITSGVMSGGEVVIGTTIHSVHDFSEKIISKFENQDLTDPVVQEELRQELDAEATARKNAEAASNEQLSEAPIGEKEVSIEIETDNQTSIETADSKMEQTPTLEQDSPMGQLGTNIAGKSTNDSVSPTLDTAKPNVQAFLSSNESSSPSLDSSQLESQTLGTTVAPGESSLTLESDSSINNQAKGENLIITQEQDKGTSLDLENAQTSEMPSLQPLNENQDKSEGTPQGDLGTNLGALGLTGLGTAGLGTAVATLGMNTQSDATTDGKKGKLYSDERIVIKDDSKQKYENQQRENSGEVSQDELNRQLEDGEYELQEGETLASRIGTQFFATSRGNVDGKHSSLEVENNGVSVEESPVILNSAVVETEGSAMTEVDIVDGEVPTFVNSDIEVEDASVGDISTLSTNPVIEQIVSTCRESLTSDGVLSADVKHMITNLDSEVVAGVIENAIDSTGNSRQLVRAIIDSIDSKRLPDIYKNLLTSSSIKGLNTYLKPSQMKVIAEGYLDSPVHLNQFINNLNSVSVSKLMTQMIRVKNDITIASANNLLSKLHPKLLQKLIKNGSLNEYANSLTIEQLKNSVLGKYAFQVVNHGDLDLSGQSIMLLSSEQRLALRDVITAVKEEYSTNGKLSDKTISMIAALDSKSAIIFVDKVLNSKKFSSLITDVVVAINTDQIVSVISQTMNRSDAKQIIDSLTEKQVVAVVDVFANRPQDLKNFFSKLSTKKVLSAVDTLNLLNEYDKHILEIIRTQFNYFEMSSIQKAIDSGTLANVVKKMSNEELGRKIDLILLQNVSDGVDIVDKIINIDSERVYNDMLDDGTLKYNEKLPEALKEEILLDLTDECDGEFLSFGTMSDTYGIDQGEVRKHVYYTTTKKSLISDVTKYAEFLSSKNKWSIEKSLQYAERVSKPNVQLEIDDYQYLSEYLSKDKSYKASQVVAMLNDGLVRTEDRVYKSVLNKLVSTGIDKATATMILDSIDTTGVCSYASVANMIFNTYRNNPAKFKADFGFKLFGLSGINSLELLADMYIYINSDACGGKLFKNVNGKITVVGGSINTKNQIYLSNTSGIKTDIVNKYLKSKNLNLSFETECASTKYSEEARNLTVPGIRSKIARALQDGKQVSLAVYRTNKGFRFFENGEVRLSTATWNEGDAHAVFVTGITKDGVIVSTWGERRTILFEDFIDNKFAINISRIGEGSLLSTNNSVIKSGINTYIGDNMESVSIKTNEIKPSMAQFLKDSGYDLHRQIREQITGDNLSDEQSLKVQSDGASIDTIRAKNNILGISKADVLSRKLLLSDGKSIEKMISSGKLNEYLNSLTVSEINDGPLRNFAYRFANKMDLDARGDSFVLLTRAQRAQLNEFIESVDIDLEQGLVLSQETVDMMDNMNENVLIAAIDQLLDNSNYFETAKELIKFIDDSKLGPFIDKIMMRSDSKAVVSYLTIDQVISLLDYYSLDDFSRSAFYRNVSYAKLVKVAKALNDLRLTGDTNATTIYKKLLGDIDFNFIRDIKIKIKNNTLATYLNSLNDLEASRLIEKMIGQKFANSEDIVDKMLDILGTDRFNSMVMNGTLKFDVNFSKQLQSKILEVVNQQKDGKFRELGIYGVDQGDVRKRVSFDIKKRWTDDIADFASYLSKEYGLDMFEAEEEAINLTSPNSNIDADDYQTIIKYLEKKYGSKTTVKIIGDSFVRMVDSRYRAVLNKLVSKGTDVTVAARILDCIDTTGVCSYASVANLIVDAYKDNPAKFKEDFGFELYCDVDGHMEINSTELLADMYVFINSNLGGGTLFTVNNGRVVLNSSIISTDKQVFLSGDYGFRSDIVNKYLRSKNSKISVNVNSVSEFTSDDNNSAIDNLKIALVRALQEGKQVSLGVYRTKNNQFKFLDSNGVVKESTNTWSEGDGHAVYVTGVTDKGVIVSTWGKRRIISFNDFINNKYRVNFIEFRTDGKTNVNKTFNIYSTPELIKVHDGSNQAKVSSDTSLAATSKSDFDTDFIGKEPVIINSEVVEN